MAKCNFDVFSKDQEGVVVGQNPVSSFSTMHWLSGVGFQTAAYNECSGQLKSAASSENCAGGDQFAATKLADSNLGLGIGKGNTDQFSIFPGECKTSGNVQKFQLQNSISMQTATAEHEKYFELGFSQPLIYAKYPYGEQCYGVFSTYGPQLAGRIMLPLNSITDEGTIFVNAKQYNGILRRRQYRAKAALENKMLRNRKPFLHLSRHLHAMRRPRGCGGRFLNKKNSNGSKGDNDNEKIGNWQFSQPTGSQNSEVMQSDSGNSNSPRESIGSRLRNFGSEVTSVSSGGNLNSFKFNHLCHKFQSSLHHNMMSAGHGIVLPSQWVAAAISAGDGCCNIKI